MRRIKHLLLLLMMVSVSACSIQPWVLSQERGILAEPVMSFEQHPTATRYANHVYEARESARGAEGSAGGGCGCN